MYYYIFYFIYIFSNDFNPRKNIQEHFTLVKITLTLIIKTELEAEIEMNRLDYCCNM